MTGRDRERPPTPERPKKSAGHAQRVHWEQVHAARRRAVSAAAYRELEAAGQVRLFADEARP